jgi:hypothetical protein
VRRLPARAARVAAGALGLALAVAGCGETADPSVPDPTLSPDLAFACGGVAFPAAALAGPLGAETLEDPGAAALRRYVRSGDPAAEDLPRAGYRLLRADQDRLVFATSGESGPMVAVEARNVDGVWSARGLGVCQPSLVLPAGLNAATWRLPVGAPIPAPGAASFAALVTELECTSGRPAEGRVLPPAIRYEPTRVLVVFAVRKPPTTGAETCPGAPPTPVTVELREPLGKRTLLDGGVFPPGEVWSAACCG